MSGIGARNHAIRASAVFPMAFALSCIAWPSCAASTGELLSQRPPRAASATQFEAQTSTIAPSIDVTYKALSEAANAAADTFAGPVSGRSRIGCQHIGIGGSSPIKVTLFNGCADYDWRINASRNGGITFKRAGNGIEVDIPVKFAGDGNFVGELAKSIQTAPKPFNGTFVVSISGIVSVGKDFCPRIEQGQAHFAWNTPPDIELIGHTCLELGHDLKACLGPWKFPAGRMMTGQINHALQGQIDEINKKIPCDQIRNQLQQVWKTWSIPLPISNPPAYVALQPKALSVPGVIATDDGIRLIARLDATTAVSGNKPPAMAATPLPENHPITGAAGHFSLAVPLPISYSALGEVGAERLKGKPIKSGAAAITPIGIEMFPSNDKLAVGVTFRCDSRGPMRGKTGTVWFTATPTIDNNGHAVRLSDLTMTTKANSRLWPAVAAAVNSGLPKAVGATYGYDFSWLLRDSKTKLDQAIANPKNTANIKITIAKDDLHLGRTAMLPDNFVVEGLFDADVSATVLGTPK
ncbi:MAG TPA: DUF4403 family protein [Rhizomicrobium sp.]|jgi:hypothetical protein|nr:DUF4403 family protein [Rhizomicrobium sp.]